MRTLGNIILYNPTPKSNPFYYQELEKMGYFLFNATTPSGFTLSHKNSAPDIILFDFPASTSIEHINSLENKFVHAAIPNIIISEAPRALIYHPGISHYLNHDTATKYLEEILEAYCIGNKKHHILYINLKPYERSIFSKSVVDSPYSIFEVHTINAAQQYIKRNTPHIICINFLPALSKSQKLFSSSQTFYVENTQNIKEVEQFLH